MTPQQTKDTAGVPMPDAMRRALATLAVKHAGSGVSIPDLEFAMPPNKLRTLIVGTRLHDPEMVLMPDMSWSFRGIPISEDRSLTNWTLRPTTPHPKEST